MEEVIGRVCVGNGGGYRSEEVDVVCSTANVNDLRTKFVICTIEGLG